MKYEYAIQQKWNGEKRWRSIDTHFDSIKKVKDVLKNHRENIMYYESRIAKRSVGKWEVVK